MAWKDTEAGRAYYREYARSWEKRNAEARHAQRRAWAKRNVDMRRARGRRSHRYLRGLVAAEKLRRGKCEAPDCPFPGGLPVTKENTDAFDFDHRERSVKIDTVSARARISADAAEAEMAKCDLLCAVCHRLKTKREKDWQPLVATSTQIDDDLQLGLFEYDAS